MSGARATSRTRLALATLVVALLALAGWSSCASTVTPPEDPADPVTVRLLATGRHAGLLLLCADGRTVEYGYGEWGWYAQMKTVWWRAPLILVWPHTGTLGRRYVREEDLAGGYYGAGRLLPFAVASDDAAKLVARLDAEFAAGGEPLHNTSYDLWFVKHEDEFWFVHNCHDEVAEWLEELGCEVSWAPIRRGLELAGTDAN